MVYRYNGEARVVWTSTRTQPARCEQEPSTYPENAGGSWINPDSDDILTIRKTSRLRRSS